MKNNFNLVIFAYLFSCLIYCQQAFGQTKFDNLSAIYIQNVSNQSVLSVKSIDYNTNVSIGTESEAFENEWFIVQDAGDPSYYRLKNLYSSKVMSNTSGGTLIVLGEGSDDNQRWNLVNEGTNEWLIENVKTGSCLTLDNNTLSLKTKDNSASQKWNIKMVNPDYAVPEPKPLNTGRYMIGAEMCNLWDVATRPDCWKQIAPYPDRKPVTGWFKEGSPEVMDWDIKMAVDNGISFFMPCWYRAESTVGKADIKGVYDQWIDGLAKAKYKNYIKFMLIWCNNSSPGLYGGISDKNDFLNNLAPYLIDHFFKNKNYYKINNKPVLVIYDPDSFINNLGNQAVAADAISQFRQMVKAAGFDDVVLIAGWSFLATHDNSEMKNTGINYSTSYHWPTFAGITPDIAYKIAYSPVNLWPKFPESIPLLHSLNGMWADSAVISGQKYAWDTQAKFSLIPNIITCSMGWDSRAWGGFNAFRLSPLNFASLLSSAQKELDKRDSKNIEGHTIFLDNWDEFGEGHFIYPTEQYGFGYLNSIKQIFSQKDDYSCILNEINKKKFPDNNVLQNAGDSVKDFYNFDEYMKPLWKGDTTYCESVLMEKDGNSLPQGNLLFKPDNIISVTDATLQIHYTEGTDYTIDGNTIKLTLNSKAPFMTKDELYVDDPTNAVQMINGNKFIRIEPGKNEFYQDKQLFVTYIHQEKGLGNYVPPKYDKSLLPKTISKLKKQKKIKIVLFGDSITQGANSSAFDKRLPYMPAWGYLLRRKLSEEYNCNVILENSGVGGTASNWGKENVKKLVTDKKPDLVIIAFGMGDAFASNNFSPDLYKANIQSMIDNVKAGNPNCEFILVSPMLANPEAQSFSGRQAEYITPLMDLQKPGIAFANVTSAFQVILHWKKFFDLGGNGVNHPNDFIYRLYAQVIAGLLIK